MKYEPKQFLGFILISLNHDKISKRTSQNQSVNTLKKMNRDKRSGMRLAGRLCPKGMTTSTALRMETPLSFSFGSMFWESAH
jgi:hypothetical protein